MGEPTCTHVVDVREANCLKSLYTFNVYTASFGPSTK